MPHERHTKPELMGRAQDLEEQNKELQWRLDHLTKSNLGDQIVRASGTLIRWSALVGIAYFANSSIESLAGLETVSKFSILADIRADLPRWIFGIFGAGGVAYGLSQRKFRRGKTGYLTSRIADLEKMIDENRTSSGVHPSGKTQEEDTP